MNPRLFYKLLLYAFTHLKVGENLV